MVTNQNIFDQPEVFETFKDASSIQENVKFLVLKNQETACVPSIRRVKDVMYLFFHSMEEDEDSTHNSSSQVPTTLSVEVYKQVGFCYCFLNLKKNDFSCVKRSTNELLRGFEIRPCSERGGNFGKPVEEVCKLGRENVMKAQLTLSNLILLSLKLDRLDIFEIE